ncbi:MAG: MarR family transcriptional regulator [Myxococcota bacterium]
MGLIFQHVARARIKLFDQMLIDHGLTSAQVFLLNSLLREDGQSQTQLARGVGIGTVAVSGMLDRLEAADWVERRNDPTDRRTNRVWLKASIKSKARILTKAAAEVNEVAFDGMTAREVDTLLSLMRRVRSNLNTELGET